MCNVAGCAFGAPSARQYTAFQYGDVKAALTMEWEVQLGSLQHNSAPRTRRSRTIAYLTSYIYSRGAGHAKNWVLIKYWAVQRVAAPARCTVSRRSWRRSFRVVEKALSWSSQRCLFTLLRVKASYDSDHLRAGRARAISEVLGEESDRAATRTRRWRKVVLVPHQLLIVSEYAARPISTIYQTPRRIHPFQAHKVQIRRAIRPSPVPCC